MKKYLNAKRCAFLIGVYGVLREIKEILEWGLLILQGQDIWRLFI